MKAAIGNRLISSLRPANKPYEIRDSRLTGFLLRVQPSGSMTFYVEYARGRRIRIGKVGVLTPAQARDQAQEVIADSIKGIDPATAKKAAQAHDFRSFLEEVYGPWMLENRRSWKTALSRLKSSFPEFLELKLRDIHPWLVEKWRMRRLKEQVRPTTVNNDLATLKAALSKAFMWGLLESNPLSKVKLSKVDNNSKVRFLNESEETSLRQALDMREERMRCERDSANRWRRERDYPELPNLCALPFTDYLKPLVLLAINTGMRRGELFEQKWSDLDFQMKVLTVTGEVAKSGRTRHIPLNSEAYRIMTLWKKQANQTNQLVFPRANGDKLESIKTSWKNLMRESAIEKFRFHDLRHHFASRLVMAGEDLNTVRELLGHTDIQMTLRYAHLAPEHKARAVEKLIRHI